MEQITKKDLEDLRVEREERDQLRKQLVAENEATMATIDRRVMLFGWAALFLLLVGLATGYLYDISVGLSIVILAVAVNIISHVRTISNNVVKASKDMQLALLYMTDLRDDIIGAIKTKREKP